MISFSMIAIGVVVVLVIILACMSYTVAPPDKAYVITGIRKKPKILIGKSGFKIPFLQKVDKLSLGAIQIDVKTTSTVPTKEYIDVKVDSNVNVGIGDTPEMLALACKHFLNTDKDAIKVKTRELLEGNIKEIVGQMSLTEMVSDKKAFVDKVQENAVPDLARLGLELISFNVQSFSDENDVIKNLGIDNIERIRKEAAIAKSNAKREIDVAAAENEKIANDAKVKAAEEIAVRNNDLAVKQAELKKAADTQAAIADMSFSIETENQRKIREVAATEADIARTEKETDLKKQQIELREKELDALVRKEADAKRYETEQLAAADLVVAKTEAEAKRYEKEQEAEAEMYAMQRKAEGLKAEAEAKKYAALADAEGIAARGAAEAEAIAKKAEAQKLMTDASVIEMYLNMLPQAVANAAAPLTRTDKIVMYGDGNSAKMVGDVMNTTNQIIEAVNGATGIDLGAMLAGFVGGKAANKTE